MKLNKKCLLDGRIESSLYGHLAVRLDYAWKIYASSNNKYNNIHKENALAFLQKSFGTKSEADLKLLMHLKASNPHRIKNYIPRLADIYAQIEFLKQIQDPVNPELRIFVRQANQGIQELNALILSYNNAKNKKERLKALYQIYLKYKELLNKLPQHRSPASLEYIELFHHQLFKTLQTRCFYLGVPSLNEQIIEDTMRNNVTAVPNPSSLPELIANMEPEKIDELIYILSINSAFNKKQIASLYGAQEPGYAAYQRFLNEHSIEFLGGENSKNFKVINLTTMHAMVLRVDYRMTNPKDAESYLRTTAVNKQLTPLWAERQGCYNDKNNVPTCRTLIVTEFCNGTDLETYANTARAPQETIKEALNLYPQMAKTIIDIQKQGCAIPDMKNANWLIEQNQLKLGDIKSVAFTDAQGILSYHSAKNYWYQLIYSTYMEAPEMKANPINCSADKMHAFMFGRNLYQFLCNAPYYKLAQVTEKPGATSDFNHPIFSTAEGREFKNLIQRLTDEIPKKRPTMSEALTFLHAIKNSELYPVRQECQALLQQIQMHSFGKQDQGMSHFIKTYQGKLADALDVKKIGEMKNELTETLQHLEQDPVLKTLREFINKFRHDCRFYTIGMNAKALRIEQAIAAKPLQARFNLKEDKTILASLAAHRHPLRTNPIKKDGHIDSNKAANTYRLFKSKFPEPRPSTESAPTAKPRFF